mmetsp:Transcript_67683/g.140325  ORF Transcript_67683/g.140325 Transcript_67683/m.140325 type:complete len:201 (-) Transcript_67683:126-728(-)
MLGAPMSTAAALSSFALRPPVTSCEAVSMETPFSSSSPLGSTKISGTSWAPDSHGGFVKTPSTSVTNTADFAPSSRQSSTIQTSPLRIATPCDSSKTASPCTTGTKPRPSRPLVPSTVEGESLPPTSFFAEVSTKGHGDIDTAGRPSFSRAVMTCLFNVVTESRVLAKPSRSRSESAIAFSAPFETPYSLACWWPKEPAP